MILKYCYPLVINLTLHHKTFKLLIFKRVSNYIVDFRENCVVIIDPSYRLGIKEHPPAIIIIITV